MELGDHLGSTYKQHTSETHGITVQLFYPWPVDDEIVKRMI